MQNNTNTTPTQMNYYIRSKSQHTTYSQIYTHTHTHIHPVPIYECYTDYVYNKM